jgi:hypothetical protein
LLCFWASSWLPCFFFLLITMLLFSFLSSHSCVPFNYRYLVFFLIIKLLAFFSMVVLSMFVLIIVVWCSSYSRWSSFPFWFVCSFVPPNCHTLVFFLIVVVLCSFWLLWSYCSSWLSCFFVLLSHHGLVLCSSPSCICLLL